MRDATNLDFFLQHAHPGMVGLVGAEAPWRVMPSLIRSLGGWLLKGGEDSAWSHVFLVLDRGEDETGALVVTLAESTVVGPLQRSDGYVSHPGFPRWNGPQVSRLAIRRPDGDVEGQPDRLPVRRYSDDTYTPNVCLVDPGLTPAQWDVARRRCQELLLDDSIDYGSMELVGTFWSTLKGRLGEANAFDSEDLFCTAFLRDCLDPHVPALQSLGVHPSNTYPEHLYQAFLKAGFPRWELVRSPTIPGLHVPLCALAREVLDEWGQTRPAPVT